MCRKLLLSLAALAAMTMAAAAADLPNTKEAPAFTPPPPPVFSWTGFYAGINGGYEWDKAHFGIDPTGGWLDIPGLASNVVTSTTDSLYPHGFLGGGQIGWNYQFSQIVAGLEGDFDYVDANSSFYGGPIPGTSIVSFSQEARDRWLSTVRGRLGYLIAPQVLIYGTGGLAIAEWDVNMHMTSDGVDAIFSDSSTRVGWTAGGGVEVAFGHNWSAKVEYLHAQFSSASGTSIFPPPNAPGATQDHRVTLETDAVRAGIDYHFDFAPPPAPPVVAKY
jgi:outer membrane immunogenic protein